MCLISAAGIVPAAQPQSRNAASLGSFSQSLETLAARVRPAVVQIVSTGYGRVPGSGQGTASLLARQRSTGSGVILTADGYIITNYHVVEGARRIDVRLAAPEQNKTQSVLPAKLIGIDRQSDLAVIKIDRTGLPSLTLGESKNVHEGQLVMAFGNPLGLEGSVSMGVVSSTARQVRDNNPIGYVQTDAPINPGNSGGPLVDTEGRVVGIDTFILSQSGGSEGIGFAIPSDIVKSVYDQIRKDGHVHRGQVGVVTQTITPEMAKVLKLPRDYGVIIADVTPDGPADKAGLKQGDVILTLNGKPIVEAREMQNAIYSQALDNQVSITVNREGKELSFTVPVIERDDDPQRFADLVDRDKNLIRRLGVFAIEIDDKIKDMLPELRRGYGLVVAAETADPPYSGESLQTGDVIYEVNTVPAVTGRAVSSTLDALKPGDPVVLLIERDGGLMYLTIELE
ncbi:MAG TPA: trypsin-like peptidase domain-containing protein [Bryobacteraceae bacterium]|nr:trypsin-like peptidase domain-containing protein [Bryobacteraceae bacterium]